MAHIIRQTTIVQDWMHNGFTDLQFHWDSYWVAYRKGRSHASLDGEVTISVSMDRTRFREAARIKVKGDNRDPKLILANNDKMALTIPSWQGGYAPENLKQFISFSEDGFNWNKSERILEDGQWLWRVREHEGVYYGSVHDIYGMSEKTRTLRLMTSSDLLNWEHLCVVGDPDMCLGENDIHFFDDGEAWMVMRSEKKPGYSFFASAQAPYTNWEITPLDTHIHACIILEDNGRLFVSGRKKPSLEGNDIFPSVMSLGVWELTKGKVKPVLHIPAMGDCSYPGFIKDPEGRVCMSYYSQHSYLMGVIPPKVPLKGEDGFWTSFQADVFFAELCLDDLDYESTPGRK